VNRGLEFCAVRTGESISIDRRAASRRAYILVVVLGFTAVVTALGWAFLAAHSTVMPEAVNRYGGVRAQYKIGRAHV
jgi:hypothetical protein